MGGFWNALGKVGMGMLDQTAAGRVANRYHRRPGQQRPAMGPPQDTTQSPEQTADDIANMQAIQPEDPGMPQEDASGPMGYDSMARGQLVTKPTIARLGESGPEAVIPLNNKAGNHVRPDLLEGHLAAPHVPGMRYQKFKGYVSPTY